MDEGRFRERVAAWCALPGELDGGGYLGYPHPLDAKLDALCALYAQVTPAQREQLVAHILPAEAERPVASATLASLLTYIGRCGRRMTNAEDIAPLRRGLTAAMMVGDLADERDLAVALVFLRAGVMRAGIPPQLVSLAVAETLAAMPDDGAESAASQAIRAVFNSDEATITRIVAYHAGTG